MDKIAQILFEYLKDILYSPEKANLDLDTLPEEFQKLGLGMQHLAEWVKEESEFAKSLAKGDLSKNPPKSDNMLAAPIKSLQSSLRHLVWQTQQVAKGDFSQKVDFMGDFSEAFNTMTQQLYEKTESLKEEKQLVESMNQELEKNLELMLALTNYTHNMIMVISVKEKENIFQNQPAQWLTKTSPETAKMLWNQLTKKELSETVRYDKWETELLKEEKCSYYGVESFYINWTGVPAIVHIITDETQRKEKENLIYTMAYLDPLTGLNNRRYALEKMERYIKENQSFVLSLIDVDYLKYCNDKFGHKSGDEYLKNVANILKTMHCEVCRIGGDEFYLIAVGNDKDGQNRQLSYLREFLIAQKDSLYPQSFSYATIRIPENVDRSLDEYIHTVDEMMYEFKQKNKKRLEDSTYQDDRI